MGRKAKNPRGTYRETAWKRRVVLAKIKVASGCIDCGYNAHSVALDFDHVEPSKKLFSISSEIGRHSWDEIMEEVEKCEIRCSNCHRVKTEKARKNHIFF